jgi:hypothetical protein
MASQERAIVKKNAKMNNARYVGIVLRSVPREGGTDLLAPITCLAVNFAHIRQTHSWTSQYSSGNEMYRVRAVRTREYCPDTVGSYLSKATMINPWTRVTARNEIVQTLILMLRTRSWIAFGGPQGYPGPEHSNRQIKEYFRCSRRVWEH